MPEYISTFKRYEKKYLLSAEKYAVVRKAFEGRMMEDSYGLCTICSIYYDTDSFELIRSSIEKPVYKEKLRLRSYGVPEKDGTVFLEIKKKYKGVVYKRREAMPLCEAETLLRDGKAPEKDGQIIREIEWLLESKKPAPKVFLAYDRLALYDREDESLRITFDNNIRWRETDLELSKGDYGAPVCDSGDVLMEIKTAGAIPLWLCSVLSENEIYPVSFSKYGTCYQNHIIKEYLMGGSFCA